MTDSLTLRPMKSFEVTIESGESLSAEYRLNGWKIARILMPDAWTTAALTFQESYDGNTFRDVYNSGSEVSLAVGANQSVNLDGATLLPAIKYLKVRSGTSGTPVTQGAERVITFICIP